MSTPSRMPNHDVRNDGIGPYAVFYCEVCDREHRSQPDLRATIAKDLGRKTMGGLLRNVPMVGSVLADNVAGEDPRYVYSLTPEQVEAAWGQVKERFRECPTCLRVMCLSDFDEQSGYCQEDSPRADEITEARAEQAGATLKGIANAFGLGEAFKQVGQAARQAANTGMARCPQDGTLAAAGTKFCPECGSPMTQPAAATCTSCGQPVGPAKFCPNCGTRVEPPAPPAGVCPACGAQAGGAKFCPECGTKMI